VNPAPPFSRVRRDSPRYPASLPKLLGTQVPDALTLRGDLDLLERPLLAVVCSVRVPDSVILRTYDLTRALRDAGVPVIGGFQSPMEKECLDFLLRGSQPVVVCPARGIKRMRLPAAWQRGLDEGRLLLLSRFSEKRRRPTTAMAEARNRLVAALADRIFIPHAEPGGRTYKLAALALRWGKPVFTLDDPHNRDLVVLGARPADYEVLTGLTGFGSA
jgi:predicted Rossmann fold nucleotide-binding protein DprA/Smf involved in DNA uptake